jgi:hypothetical protein
MECTRRMPTTMLEAFDRPPFVTFVCFVVKFLVYGLSAASQSATATPGVSTSPFA